MLAGAAAPPRTLTNFFSNTNPETKHVPAFYVGRPVPYLISEEQQQSRRLSNSARQISPLDPLTGEHKTILLFKQINRGFGEFGKSVKPTKPVS